MLMPMNSTPQYMTSPNEARHPRMAEMTPTMPNQGFDLTQSAIRHVMIIKPIIQIAVTEKYGITENVFRSNSAAKVRTVNRATEICFHLSCLNASVSNSFCSHCSPL